MTRIVLLCVAHVVPVVVTLHVRAREFYSIFWHSSGGRCHLLLSKYNMKNRSQWAQCSVAGLLVVRGTTTWWNIFILCRRAEREAPEKRETRAQSKALCPRAKSFFIDTYWFSIQIRTSLPLHFARQDFLEYFVVIIICCSFSLLKISSISWCSRLKVKFICDKERENVARWNFISSFNFRNTLCSCASDSGWRIFFHVRLNFKHTAAAAWIVECVTSFRIEIIFNWRREWKKRKAKIETWIACMDCRNGLWRLFGVFLIVTIASWVVLLQTMYSILTQWQSFELYEHVTSVDPNFTRTK